MKIKVGFGYDVHQLKKGRAFWLGGIEIPHHKGGDGHSDADVLLHAICDALLGAANLGDIGTHFPPSDPQYKNIDSKILLAKVFELVKQKGFTLSNIDATVALQLPKIMPYIAKMKQAILNCIELEEDDLSIKATTTEKLGFEGRQEGVSAYATVLIMKD